MQLITPSMTECTRHIINSLPAFTVVPNYTAWWQSHNDVNNLPTAWPQGVALVTVCWSSIGSICCRFVEMKFDLLYCNRQEINPDGLWATSIEPTALSGNTYLFKNTAERLILFSQIIRFTWNWTKFYTQIKFLHCHLCDLKLTQVLKWEYEQFGTVTTSMKECMLSGISTYMQIWQYSIVFLTVFSATLDRAVPLKTPLKPLTTDRAKPVQQRRPPAPAAVRPAVCVT